MTEQLRIFAGLQGFVSAAGLIALALFFTLGLQDRRWAWFGPVNDWLYVLGAVPWIVASVLLMVHVRARAPLWGYTIVVCLLIAAGGVVTLLMLAGRVGLGAQFAVSGPMTFAGFIWLWPAAAAAVEAAALPRWMLMFSIVVMVTFLVGGAVVGAALLVPAESAVRSVLFVAGGIPVGLAMAAFPTWWLLVAAQVR
ncbi:hypothetical protein [Microbacterium sp. SD291]|uniref:hypothetical protein n=1 Tax=Microbacterium sp. SD291 TaxID=2782007 RepID=UPI001A97911A|nr:hypothetical protein [Microbacterium sp. SD291]MBO0981660.1 hypothetical protein [Microbacterium sp. SD291]